MRRFAAIILLLAFASLATGIPQRVHQAQHDCRDCRVALLALIQHHNSSNTPAKPHSEQGCLLCALLYAPALASSPPVIMVDAGASFTEMPRFMAAQAISVLPARLTCRGPPGC